MLSLIVFALFLSGIRIGSCLPTSQAITNDYGAGVPEDQRKWLVYAKQGKKPDLVKGDLGEAWKVLTADTKSGELKSANLTVDLDVICEKDKDLAPVGMLTYLLRRHELAISNFILPPRQCVLFMCIFGAGVTLCNKNDWHVALNYAPFFEVATIALEGCAAPEDEEDEEEETEPRMANTEVHFGEGLYFHASALECTKMPWWLGEAPNTLLGKPTQMPLGEPTQTRTLLQCPFGLPNDDLFRGACQGYGNGQHEE